MNKLTDEQIDNLIKTLTAKTSVDEALIEEISTSPAGWWAVKRNIPENASKVTPWPPVSIWKRLFPFAVPTMAGLLLVLGVYVWVLADRPETAQTIPVVAHDVQSTGPVASNQEAAIERNQLTAAAAVPEPVVAKKKAVVPNKKLDLTKRQPTKTPKTQVVTGEISTEFIALSHAGGPESGQLIRVKVPSSMMVSLGVIPSVAKPSSLVNAEVVVGDDGQTHAIRFIR